MLGASAGVGSYGDSARRLGRRMRSVRKRPAVLLGAVLGWIAAEAGRLPQAAEETAGGWSAAETALIAAAATLAVLASIALVA